MKSEDFKTFDKIYNKLTHEKGNIDKQLAHDFYNAGMEYGLSETILNLAKMRIHTNSRISNIFHMEIDGIAYKGRLICNVQKEEEKTIDETAEEIAESMMKEVDENNLKEILKKAVMLGYGTKC